MNAERKAGCEPQEVSGWEADHLVSQDKVWLVSEFYPECNLEAKAGV